MMAALLSVPLPEGRDAPLTFSPQQQRQYTHDALVAWITEESERTPMLVVFEDLHWADASTMEMVGVLVEEVPTVRMLIVLTARPEFATPWSPRSHLTPLTLNRLERPQVAALVTHLAGSTTLPEDVIRHVVSKTDGVPLFVEELTKTLLESDILQVVDGHYRLIGPLAHLSIPSTLHDSLMARLDRLPESKQVAQLGAVLGREFAYDMVKALTTEVDATLQLRLGELVEAELLYQRGRPPRSKYTFKHALIQDAAYASLLRSTRQAYHRAVAEMLEQQFPDLIETQPELVADHYTEAGLSERAIPYWLKAGQRAAHRSANVEAISHFNKGLEVLADLPDTLERAHQELALQAALGPVLIATKSWAAPETGVAWQRARVLCQQVGETPLFFPVLYGAWSFYVVRPEHKTAHGLAVEFLDLAQRRQDAGALVEARFMVRASQFFLTEFLAAREHLEQGIKLYGTQPRPELAVHPG
jgi:predicted ATPase